MIGFLGLGAAGGNLADEAMQQNFPAIAINYSQQDLGSLDYIEETLQLVGSEGVGKNRSEAIRLMDRNWESVVSFVKEHFSTPAVEVIFVCFSTAGGSGSGMAPILLEIMQSEMPDKTFVAVPILPDTSEVFVNQYNCIQTSEELSNVSVPVFPIDNEQMRKRMSAVGKGVLYSYINQTFVSTIAELYSYTTKQSKDGILDKKDLAALLATEGVSLIASANINELKNETIKLTAEGTTDIIVQSWHESIFCIPSYSRIVRAGLIFDGHSQFMNFIQPATIFDVFESGMPIDLFEGYYQEQSGKVITILTGLDWYRDRMHQIEGIIKDSEQKTSSLLNANETYKSSVNTFPNNSKTKKRKKVGDILNKYKR